jgi:hypothetical protein
MRHLVRRRVFASGDEGIGMILVIGIAVFVFSIVLAATAYAISGLKQAQQRTFFEQSLGASERGIDTTLSNLQTAFSKYNADYPVPNNAWTKPSPAAPACALPPVSWPAVISGTPVSDATGTFIAAAGRTAEQNEKTWASQQLNALRATPGCVVTDGSGKDKSQVVILKPVTALVNGLYPKYGKVYSLAAIPSFSDPKAVVRLLKAEYIFMPYRPTHAVLTGSDLNFQGDTNILPAAGVAPEVTGVHANGNIEVTGGSATLDGPVTATGTIDGSVNGATEETPNAKKQDIPTVSAENLYYQAADKAATAIGGWYDLCDGVLKNYSSGGPCTGTSAGATTRNWTWDGASRTWTANRDVLPGTYYVDDANVVSGTGNGVIDNLTVIASRDNTPSCSSRRYGNINWSHYDISTPSFPNLWFYADGDVQVTSNIRIGQNTPPTPVSGMVVGGDQVELYTQSNSAVGAVVAADQCKAQQPADSLIDTNTVHSNLYYDPNSDAPFTSVITNTLWLDYSN